MCSCIAHALYAGPAEPAPPPPQILKELQAKPFPSKGFLSNGKPRPRFQHLPPALRSMYCIFGPGGMGPLVGLQKFLLKFN